MSDPKVPNYRVALSGQLRQVLDRQKMHRYPGAYIAITAVSSLQMEVHQCRKRRKQPSQAQQAQVLVEWALLALLLLSAFRDSALPASLRDLPLSAASLAAAWLQAWP